MVELIAETPSLRYLLLFATFALVSAAVYFGATGLSTRDVTRSRLVGQPGDVAGKDLGVGSLRTAQGEGAWLTLVNAIEKTGLSLVDTKDDTVRRLMVSAGYTAPYAPRVYTLARLVLVVVLPLLVVTIFWMTGASPSLTKLYMSLLVAAALGLYIPNVFVRAKASRRQRDIINGFPDALDLMLVCVEAGLGLEAAFGRVGQEMVASHPLLAEQLGNVVLELRAGRSREDALRRMADRADADEIRAFATLLIQSTKLGSSVAQTLRVYAAEMRERRRMRAEEKAHRLPVLLSLPLVGCMLPTMIGVLMLPAAIGMYRTIIPAMGGD